MTDEIVPASDASAYDHEHDENVEIQAKAERTIMTRIFKGALIGAVICSGLWVCIVLLALSGSSQRKGPVLLIGILTGVIAGLFLGGCIGALYGAQALEHAEHELLPKAG
jgi:hypothetical protein